MQQFQSALSLIAALKCQGISTGDNIVHIFTEQGIEAAYQTLLESLAAAYSPKNCPTTQMPPENVLKKQMTKCATEMQSKRDKQFELANLKYRSEQTGENIGEGVVCCTKCGVCFNSYADFTDQPKIFESFIKLLMNAIEYKRV